MKKFSKKSAVLFAGVMAVCAFAMPSMASALGWGPVGGADHTLTSTNLSFTTEQGAASIGSSCVSSSFTGVVDNAATLTITGTSFTNCMGIGAGVIPCTVTATGTNFPWIATATNPVTIHRLHVTVQFENTPGAAGACPAPVTVTLTGRLTAGTFNNVEHGIPILPPTSGTGLVGHPGPVPVTVTGTITDPHSAANHQLTLS